jgi:hypothetical protein
VRVRVGRGAEARTVAAVSGLSQWIEEAARFSRQRFREDRETLNCMSRCSTWSDFAALQGRWVSTALQDYLAEAGRTGWLFQRCLRGAAEGAKFGLSEPGETA